MLNRLSQHLFEKSITHAYTRRFREKGAQAEGVFWASRLSQTARFDHVLTQIANCPIRPCNSLADIGCGYGALWHFIQHTERYRHLHYRGYDINKSMVAYCKQHYPEQREQFALGRKPDVAIDFAVFIGTFNLCHSDDYALWQDYILRQLSLSWQQVRTGMVLNITSLPKAKIQNQIFYVEPDSFKNKLKSCFGQVIASPTRYVDNDMTYLILKQSG